MEPSILQRVTAFRRIRLALLLLLAPLPSCYFAGHQWRFISRQPKETMLLSDTLGIPDLMHKLDQRKAPQPEVWTATEWNIHLREEMQSPEGRSSQESYHLVPGDRISVQVADEPVLSKDYYIRPDGTFSFPYIGELPVEGKSIREVEESLKQSLLVYFKDPQVIVNLEQGPQRLEVGGSAKPDFGDIMVYGEVGGGLTTTTGGITGRIMSFSGKDTLFKIITRSGGLSPRANWRTVAVFRREPDPKAEGGFKTMVIISDMSNFFKHADFEQNVPLKVNDVVFVPTQPESIGVAFQHDWDLVLNYLGGITAYDDFVRRLSDTGHILPRATQNSAGDPH